MEQRLMKDPGSGLILPQQFVDQKQALKKVISDLVDGTVLENQRRKDTYFLVLHMKFNEQNPEEFHITPPQIVETLPPFTSNQMVFWVNNSKGICEILWMVRPKKKGGKLQVDFNKSGVAYLQMLGAMATSHQGS
jgi:hypothetical protein